MKFKKCEVLTQTKIKRWFNESFYSEEYKLAHFYKHDKFAYTVIMIKRKYGTVSELYIDTETVYATVQTLSAFVVHKAQDISDLVFDK